MPESPHYTNVALPGARVTLRVQRERGQTAVVDGATGIFGLGTNLRTALDDFTRAVREHRQVLESCTPRSAILQAQLETVREYLGLPRLAREPEPEADATFLTLSQGMRLASRYALPAIDPLIEALEHAAVLDQIPDRHRQVLSNAATGLRRTCRPVAPTVRPNKPCWRCPPGVGDLIDLKLPHTGNGHQIYTYLLRAGYTDCAELSATPDTVLRAIKGISVERLEEIRREAPYAGGDDA